MAINIGNRRELFVDDFLVDEKRTTAGKRLNHPVRRECVMTNDSPWEANGWVYYTVFKDGDIFRMYYITYPMSNKEKTEHVPYFYRICYAESRDGITWHKPALGICEIDGSTENNVIVITSTMDAFHVFIDKNPDCPEGEKYKGIYTKPKDGRLELRYMTSSDGVHFEEAGLVSNKGSFDSHNVVFWDENIDSYVCYARDFHTDANGYGIRDIRRMVSKDFKNWTEPELIEYIGSHYDFHMYTNGIQQYFRAPHIYVGFPARYTERTEWTANYDRLCGREGRKWRMTLGTPRYGLALTDGLFMSSRDGKSFNRWNEAFVRPGPESPMRWVYGDGYLSYGMLETATDVEGEDKEMSFYATANDWADEPVKVFRYTLRTDGFVCRTSGFEPREVVTKPIIFDGNNLYINFSTSAAGYLRIFLEDENGKVIPGYDSGELFGDSIDRLVDFEKPLSALKGKSVVMRIELCDAEIYAFQFGK